MTRLSVDTRWLDGHHGIARWAREVVPLLPFPWEPLAPDLKKASVPDVLWLGHALRNYDVHFSPGYNAGARLHRRSARQLIVIHDLIHLDVPAESSRVKRAYYDSVVRPAITRTGTVLTVSEFSRDRIAEWSGLPAEQVVVASGAVSSQLLKTQVRRHPESSQRPYVLFVGNGKPHKRLAAAVRAVLDDPGGEFDLVVVGAVDDAGPDVRARVDTAGDRVRVVTDVDDAELASWYAGSHCLLFPSSYEGFGLPALEALALGVPVVWSCEAVRGIVGDLGVHVSVDDGPEGLREGIVAAGVLRERNGWERECVARAASFSWDRCGALVTDVIEGML